VGDRERRAHHGGQLPVPGAAVRLQPQQGRPVRRPDLRLREGAGRRGQPAAGRGEAARGGGHRDGRQPAVLQRRRLLRAVRDEDEPRHHRRRLRRRRQHGAQVLARQELVGPELGRARLPADAPRLDALGTLRHRARPRIPGRLINNYY